MYEMLTGKVPFDADTPVSVALKHMQEEPKPPIESNPNIPQAVNDIIMKALKKDTEQRYQSATEMLQDLKRALKEPEGDFVESNDYVDFPTQRISTISGENYTRNKKKESKFKTFVGKHKVLVFIIVLIILFVISLGGTILYFRLTEPKDVQIPNLVGKTTEEAETILKENGITI